MAARSTLLALLTGGVLAVLLGGCATAGSSGSSPSPTGSVQAGSLVGVWTVEGDFSTPERPYIAFVQDNTWSASDGCNRVRGTWQVASDGSLSTTSGPQTLTACDGVQLPMLLVATTSVEVTPDSLTLIGTGDAATTTVLVRSSDSTVGPQGRPIGYWAESRTPASPFLNFSTDGTYSGNDGCNNLTGTWVSKADDAVVLTGGATTLRACEGVDDWLGRAVQGRVLAGVMTLQAVDGTVLGQLTAL
ncbi:META domain-containing protein [Cryobacterium sp. MLB-32]|uniref:META domain-containing protein n=1 Tax=Cryobacterium sp. MLB-32 TaxID=1529318 RepID=UPI00068FBD51|nr:META domain-containing protein [Cryobacterium sp. MLB-32]